MKKYIYLSIGIIALSCLTAFAYSFISAVAFYIAIIGCAISCFATVYYNNEKQFTLEEVKPQVLHSLLHYQQLSSRIDAELSLNYEQFAQLVKNFKKEYGIKSLRREVFGVSNDEKIMQEIIARKKVFYKIPGVIKFLTRDDLIKDGKRLQLPAPANDNEMKYKGQKYERIALLRIRYDWLKNKHDYLKKSFLYLYDKSGVSVDKGVYKNLLRQHHNIPAFAQTRRDKEKPFSDVEKESSDFLDQSDTYHTIGFASYCDIGGRYAHNIDKVILPTIINDRYQITRYKSNTTKDKNDNLDTLLTARYPDKDYVFVRYTYPSQNEDNFHHVVLVFKTNQFGEVEKVLLIDSMQLNNKKLFNCEVPIKKIVLRCNNQDLQYCDVLDFNCSIFATYIIEALIGIDKFIIDNAFQEIENDCVHENIDIMDENPNSMHQLAYALCSKQRSLSQYFNYDEKGDPINLKSLNNSVIVNACVRQAVARNYLNAFANS
jgi:hypothetical protein